MNGIHTEALSIMCGQHIYAELLKTLQSSDKQLIS